MYSNAMQVLDTVPVYTAMSQFVKCLTMPWYFVFVQTLIVNNCYVEF